MLSILCLKYLSTEIFLLIIVAHFAGMKQKNTLPPCELFSSEPFLYKVGSKEAGQKWAEVSEKLNCYSLVRDMPREHFSKLLKDYEKRRNKRKNENKEERAGGINPDPPTENEVMLEEIAEAMESTPLHVKNANSKTDDKKKKEALACRHKAKAGASGDISHSRHESDTEKSTVKRRGRQRRASSDPFHT